MAENTPASLYFAYGSNLSPFQMRTRCPESEPLALAHLPHPWAWLINARGYANVVETSQPQADGNNITEVSPGPDGLTHNFETANGTAIIANGDTTTNAQITEGGPGVYGVLYHLPRTDEELLDVYEGVPFSYQKALLPVTIVATKSSKKLEDYGETFGCKLQPSGTVEALVYVDHNNTSPDEPWPEYIARMNRGIDEAMEQFGLPAQYVEEVMRPFIPKGDWEGAGISSGTGE